LIGTIADNFFWIGIRTPSGQEKGIAIRAFFRRWSWLKHAWAKSGMAILPKKGAKGSGVVNFYLAISYFLPPWGLSYLCQFSTHPECQSECWGLSKYRCTLNTTSSSRQGLTVGPFQPLAESKGNGSFLSGEIRSKIPPSHRIIFAR
jgi:hypothetical protein